MSAARRSLRVPATTRRVITTRRRCRLRSSRSDVRTASSSPTLPTNEPRMRDRYNSTLLLWTELNTLSPLETAGLDEPLMIRKCIMYLIADAGTHTYIHAHTYTYTQAAVFNASHNESPNSSSSSSSSLSVAQFAAAICTQHTLFQCLIWLILYCSINLITSVRSFYTDKHTKTWLGLSGAWRLQLLTVTSQLSVSSKSSLHELRKGCTLVEVQYERHEKAITVY